MEPVAQVSVSHPVATIIPAQHCERKVFPPADLSAAGAAIPPRHVPIHLLLTREIVGVGNPNTFSSFGDLNDHHKIDPGCK